MINKSIFAKINRIVVITTILTGLFGIQGFTQQTIRGKIMSDTEPLIGATVFIEGTNNGTLTGLDGKFELTTNEKFPVTLIAEFLGYQSARVTVNDSGEHVVIELSEGNIMLDQVVVGASRYEERIVEAPVTVYKLDARSLKQMAGMDYYESLAGSRGVHSMSSSMSLPSFNTRGFADPGNFRFKQQLDGVDMTNPIGLSISNSVGASDLDISSIELIPGASSALYGSDAFNGLLRMYTKNPFDSEGISFLTKSGASVQDVAGTNFFGEFNLRFAHKMSRKFAFKIDFHHRRAYDWIGDDDSHRIPPNAWDNRAQFEALDIDDPDGYVRFDAVHRVGDEYGNGIGVINQGVDLIGPDGEILSIAPRTLTRSGIWEEDLVDNELKNTRANFSFFYRPNEDWELSYTYKHSFGDWLIRSSVTFPQYDYLQRLHVFEAKHGGWLNVRSYMHKLDNFRGSWSAPNAADAIQRALRPDDLWIQDLQQNYAQTGNLRQARAFADRFMPGGSEFNKEDFEAALAATSNNTDFAGTNSNLITGSQAVDYSSYYNTDVDFDLTQFVRGFQLQTGINLRYYNVESNGTFYNDGPLGFGSNIGVFQFGVYGQATDRFLDDRLKVTAAMRLDYHQDYEEAFSPRLAMVYSVGADRNHHFRFAAQRGFRYPSIQEGFFRLQLTSAFTVIGAAERSLNNFIHEGRTGEQFTMAQIIEEDGRNLQPVGPERNTIYEAGYKTLFGDKLFIDVNAYHTRYLNFINRPIINFRPGTPNFQLFAIRQNRPETVTSTGAGISMDYKLTNDIRVDVGYDWADFDSPDYKPTDEAVADDVEKEAFLRSLQFNSPEHRLNAGITGSRMGDSKRWGFMIRTHFTSAFNYFSNFGEQEIGSVNYTDASVSYRLPKYNTTLKLAGSNIFGQEYNYVYGSPNVGSIFYLAIRYEEL